MLINIGVLGVRRKKGGFLIFGAVKFICVKDFLAAAILICTARKKILPKHGQLIKTKKVEKEKNGLYIYIFNILFFFFFFSRFFLPLSLLLNAAAARNPLFFLAFFYSSQ